MLRDLVLADTQKAFSADTAPIPPFAVSSGVSGRRLTGRTAARFMGAYGGEDAIDWVMDCVDLYAQTGSNAKYYFTEPTDPGETGGSVRPQPVESPPGDLVNLFNSPNNYMDWVELIELAIIDFLVAGEFFWLKYKVGNDPNSSQFGKPLALYRLSPALVEIEMDDNNNPKAVIYNSPGRTGQPARFRPQDVVHVKRPNPHDQWRGLSHIAASPRAMDIELAVTEAMANYYENGTRPSGTLESDRTVPPSTWTKIKRQFSQLYQGTASAGSVVMLERGLKFTPMSGSATDADYENIANLSQKRIAKAFKVPLPLLGEVGASDRLAVREAQRIFDNKVMRPFLNRIQSQLSRQLTQAWGLDLYIDYGYTIPAEEKLELAEAMATVPGVTVKELRAQIDLEPLENDPDIPDGKEIDNTVLNLPGLPEEEGGFADQPIGDEAGRPPNPENTRAFPKGGPLPKGAAARSPRGSERAARQAIRNARQKLAAGRR